MTIALLEHIRQVPEHRVPGLAAHRLDEMLLSKQVGVLRGGDDWETIERSSPEYLAWLKQFPS